ncbi:hypothetical protein SDC9_77447 [bioreactor metagenome]|uniref:Uncharacterized protein n=1 Tax=bioreactor metagenome TaxID=1076179 RepID=A0A644YQM3_9ZZZZ
MAARVVDDPVARDQLRGHVTGVGHGDRIGEAEHMVFGIGLVRQVLGEDLDRELILGHGDAMVTGCTAFPRRTAENEQRIGVAAKIGG